MMAQQLTELQHKAGTACRNRGHELEWDDPEHKPNRSLQNAICVKCGKEVHLNTNPMPNEIDIGGEALAIDCE